jgi:hypothetical protein
MPRWLALVIVALVLGRMGYHLAYLADVPFAAVTISDGRVYELAAQDLIDHPPWGTQPFYLQGLYAYFMAVPMGLVLEWPGVALLAQLGVAGLGLWGFHRTAARAFGGAAGGLSTALLLAYPGLAFYENKYLSASLGVVCDIAMLGALGLLLRKPTAARMVVVGAAVGLATLARPNLLLALPAAMVAAAWAALARAAPSLATAAAASQGTAAAAPRLRQAAGPGVAARLQAAVLVGLGFGLAVAPMAARNWIVVGRPELAPAHGGGTSFYIGNNRGSKGLWNGAGVFSGDLLQERAEVAASLGLAVAPDTVDPRVLGQALYRKAWAEIAEDPPRFAGLLARKAWLTLGNAELAQDFDRAGEAELLPPFVRVGSWLGLPFGLLLGLGVLGCSVLLRAARAPAEGSDRAAIAGTDRLAPAAARAWLWQLAGLGGAVLAANVIYFTSAQHRLPLVVPLAFVAGPGLLALTAALRAARGIPGAGPSHVGLIQGTLAAALALQAFVPRLHAGAAASPHPVHYFNLGLAWDDLGDAHAASQAFGQAVRLRPGDPRFRLEHARMLRRIHEVDAAAAELAVVTTFARAGTLSPALHAQLERERAALASTRARITAEGSAGASSFLLPSAPAPR